MKHIKEKYGIEEIMFEDDNLTLNIKRAEISPFPSITLTRPIMVSSPSPSATKSTFSSDRTSSGKTVGCAPPPMVIILLSTLLAKSYILQALSRCLVNILLTPTISGP
ncbi:hypothetical protein ES703_105571 [subsurface metagenome]